MITTYIGNELVEQYGGLDILINNAAIRFFDEPEKFVELATKTLYTNYYSTQLGKFEVSV